MMVGDHVKDQIDLSSTLVSVDTFCKIITNRNRSQLARKIFPFSSIPAESFEISAIPPSSKGEIRHGSQAPSRICELALHVSVQLDLGDSNAGCLPNLLQCLLTFDENGLRLGRHLLEETPNHCFEVKF
jgi:hypothetical protein